MPRPEHPNYAQQLIASCHSFGKDEGTAAFVCYDTCGLASPVRNCTPGDALFSGVIAIFLGIPDDTQTMQAMRDAMRQDVTSDLADPGKQAPGTLMHRSMKRMLEECLGRLRGGASGADKLRVMHRGKDFLVDVLDARVGTDVYRDPALDILRRVWGAGASLTSTGGWDTVRFPIVFHLQWDPEVSAKTGRPKMLFHTTFDPWRTAVGLAMALCGPRPPIQVRETPYKDAKTRHVFQPPRKYVIDWDLFVSENLGRAGPPEMFTDEYLFGMFVRSLAVIHACMRRCGVLPAGRRLCMSIKSRTRKAKNKAGKEDTKFSLHATVHVMEPAERHRVVISKVLDMVRKDNPAAFRAMVEKDGLQRGIHSPKRWVVTS